MTLSSYGIAAVVAGSLLASAGCATQPNTADLPVLAEPRIKPLAEAELAAGERKTIGDYRLANGKLPNILTTMAGYPALLNKYLAFVSRDSTLAPRDRELLILRVGWLRQADFMLGWHTLYARNAGLSEDEIARVAQGPGSSGWMLDLVFLVGQYDMISMYLKSAGVQLDQGVPHFPVKRH